MEEKKTFMQKVPESVKVNFFRWWFAGSVFLYIAQGTSLGQAENPTGLVLSLSLILGLTTVFIFNKIVYGMFQCKRRGVILNKKWKDRNTIERVVVDLGEILKCTLTVFTIFIVYQSVNVILNNIFGNTGEVRFAPEPIIFGTLFVLIYVFFTFIVNLIRDIFEKRTRNA